MRKSLRTPPSPPWTVPKRASPTPPTGSLVASRATTTRAVLKRLTTRPAVRKTTRRTTAKVFWTRPSTSSASTSTRLRLPIIYSERAFGFLWSSWDIYDGSEYVGVSGLVKFVL